MPESLNSNTINELRLSLKRYIESNEEVIDKFNKIMHWLFIIFAALSATIIIGISFILYTINQPKSATQVAMKQVQELSNTNIQQRKLNEIDRRDIAAARSQIAPLLKLQDSLIKVKDSIIDSHYKKAIK